MRRKFKIMTNKLKSNLRMKLKLILQLPHPISNKLMAMPKK